MLHLVSKEFLYVWLQDTTEINCLRLFLGYHGLPLLWSWMANIGSGDSEEDRMLKTEVRL